MTYTVINLNMYTGYQISPQREHIFTCTHLFFYLEMSAKVTWLVTTPFLLNITVTIYTQQS